MLSSLAEARQLRVYPGFPASSFTCFPVSISLRSSRSPPASNFQPRTGLSPGFPVPRPPCIHVSNQGLVAREKQTPTAMHPFQRVARFPCLQVSGFPCLQVPGSPKDGWTSMTPFATPHLVPYSHVSLLPCLPVYSSRSTVTKRSMAIPCSLVSMSTVLYLSNGKNPRIYPCFLLPLTGLWRAAELVQIVRTAGHSPTCFPVAPYTCSHVPKETKATNRPHNLVTRLPVALSLRVTVSRFPCSRAVPISYGSPSSSFRLKLYTRFPAPLCPGLHGAKANCHCWQKSAISLVSTFPGSHAPLSPCLASTGRVPEPRPQMRHPQNRSPVCRYTCKQAPTSNSRESVCA